MSEFGFLWPAGETGGPRVKVERMTEIRHGRGRYRILRIGTERDELVLTVTPSGMVRVHRGREELLSVRRLMASLKRRWKQAADAAAAARVFVKPCDCETCRAHRETGRSAP